MRFVMKTGAQHERKCGFMFKKNGLTALVLAVAMLFSFFSFAEDDSAKIYFRLEDPYFTDGETEYDLSGMKVEFQVSHSPLFEQLLLSVITAKGTARAAIESLPDAVSIYGDGFSSTYTMTPDYLKQIIVDRIGIPESFELPSTVELLEPLGLRRVNDIPTISIKEAIDTLYVMCLEALTDASENALTETVDTFVHTGLKAKAIDIDMSAAQIDAMLLSMLNELDAFIMSSDNPALADFKRYGSIAQLYEASFKQLNISLKGKVYVGSDSIYTVCGLYALDELLTTAYVEVLSGISSAIYVNIPVLDDAGNAMTTLYITSEANANGDGSERFELGAIEGERQMLLATIEHFGDNYDFYFGFSKDSNFIELTEKFSSDQKTYRNFILGSNINGVMYELDYDGVITTTENTRNERVDISITSNVGIAAKAVLEFGTAQFDAVSIIPSTETVPAVNLDGITEEQGVQLTVDFTNLLTQTMIILQYGVPGFAPLLAQLTQPPVG